MFPLILSFLFLLRLIVLSATRVATLAIITPATDIPTTEPGGYLQWDEGDSSSTEARSPNPGISKTATTELVGLLTYFSKVFKVEME
jgi:hypothetical protein